MVESVIDVVHNEGMALGRSKLIKVLLKIALVTPDFIQVMIMLNHVAHAGDTEIGHGMERSKFQ